MLQSPHFGNRNTLTSSMQLFPLQLKYFGVFSWQMLEIVSSSFSLRCGIYFDFWKKLLSESNIWEKKNNNWLYLNLHNKTSIHLTLPSPFSRITQLLGVMQQGQGNLEIIYIIKNILKSDSPGLQMDCQFWSLVLWIEWLERISTISVKYEVERAIIQTSIYSV